MNWGSWAVLALVCGSLVACGDSVIPSEGGEDVGTSQAAITKGSPGATLGDGDYCDDPLQKCGLGEGDCDTSSQCQSPYVCVPGNLAKRGPKAGDACAPSHCGNGVEDVDETSIDCGGTCGADCAVSCDKPNGHPSHCSTDCPCSAGEGDCDSAAECQAGLNCGTSNGAAFGLAANVDVCWAATCQNGAKDGTETAIDCGGDCAPCPPPAAGPVALASAANDALLPIVIAPHSDPAIHSKIVEIANDLRDKLNAIKGPVGAPFAVSPPTSTPGGISLGVHGDFQGAGWPYQGYFRPNDVIVGGALRPDRLGLKEQYVIRSPQGANRVIVAGATVDALRHAIWDFVGRLGYRHYFPTPTWEVLPPKESLQLVPALAVDERPAFLSRTLNFLGDAWEAPFTTVTADYQKAWRKHNRLHTETTVLTPVSRTFSSIVTWWQTKYGSPFPAELSANPAAPVSQRQPCLTGSANVNGATWTVEGVVREWAAEQTSNPISLVPYDHVDWTSAEAVGGGLNCADINHPIFSSVANRMAALLNAIAERQPTKVVASSFLYQFNEAPTLALRQNVFASIEAYHNATNPFALENRLRGWGTDSGYEVGVKDALGSFDNDFPGQMLLSTKSIVSRARSFYGLGARRYEINVQSGFGASGPAWWALAKSFWEVDTQAADATQYRSDFLTHAFGPAAAAMSDFYGAVEDRALYSETMVGVMYGALKRAFALTTASEHASVRSRLEDLAAYTRYLELSKKFWNPCNGVTGSSSSEQSQLKDLLRFIYSIRDRRILVSREAMAEVTRLVANCASGEPASGAPACDLLEWAVTCPAPTGCGSCTMPGCNQMKTAAPPSSSELVAFVNNGAATTPILDSSLVKQFSTDLVPYTLTPSLPARLQSVYTIRPTHLFIQHPSSAGPLVAHVRKYSANQHLTGRLSLLNGVGAPEFQFFPKGGTALETDWNFGSDGSWVYRLDLDDQGLRMWTTFSEPTRVAIPIGPNDPPLGLNYRWSAYFLVPAGTAHVVGWTESDGTVFRNRKGADGGWITEPATWLSDFAVGETCEATRSFAQGTAGLNDHFVIPINPPAPTDEIWLFNTGVTAGTVGDRVLLSVPPYLYQSPSGMLVPREVAPESTNPTVCSTGAPCPEGQYCSQGGFCRTSGGSCTSNSQCHPGEACAAGVCTCSGSCSATCKCAVGGACSSDAACQSGLQCVAGTCQDCSATACNGSACSIDADCANGLFCQGGQCREEVCQNIGACLSIACGATNACGQTCQIEDSSCVPDTSTCAGTTVNDGNQCTADTCDAAGKVRHYFRPTGYPCDAGACDGIGDCKPAGTHGGRGQPPLPDGTCSAGLVVGTNNGIYFNQSVEMDLCWDGSCEFSASAQCGPFGAVCGFCPGSFPPISTCQTNCQAKHCGDDPDDGCGGTCALCAPGDSGCETDADCQYGYECAIGKGERFGLTATDNVCWPEVCNSINPQTIPCGTTTSACGLCPACEPFCDGVSCGSDGCGGSCSCAQAEYCDSHEECVPIVQVLDGDLPPDFIDPHLYTTTNVGTVAGRFEVTPDGRSAYNVPITVPPGRGGMQPQLSLGYDSSVGDGALGLGWSLNGLSTIALCPKTVALDGYAHGIASNPAPAGGRDSRPRYCLDGVRLQLVDGDDGEVGGFYLTERNNHHKVLITSVDETAPANRRVTEFKIYQPDARIVTMTLTTAENGWYWLPSRVEDRSGNFMSIEYLQRDVQCTGGDGTISCPELEMDIMTLEPQLEILPTKIWYAGHAGIDPDTLVEFKYAFRTNGRRGLRSRVWFNQTRQLSAVTITLGGTPVREYRLEYEHREDVDRTLMSRLSECVPNLNNPQDVVCNSPTVFEYDPDPVGLSNPITIGTHPNNSAEGFYEPVDDLVLDMNNDGVDDLLMQVNDRTPQPKEFFSERHFEILWGGKQRQNTGLAVEPLTDARHRAIIDYNADGRDDVLIIPYQTPGNYKVLTFTAAGEFSVIDTGVPSSWADPTGGFDHASTYVLDADGDGIRDIVSCQGRVHGVDDSGPWTWRFVHVPDMTVRPINFQGNCFPHYLPLSTDGSGAQQLLMQSFYRDEHGTLINKNSYVAISFKNATADDVGGPVNVATTLTACPVSEKDHTHGIPFDANGDGMSDILVVAPSQNRPAIPPKDGLVGHGYQNGLGICYGSGTTDRTDQSAMDSPLFVRRSGLNLYVEGQTQPFLLGPVMDVNGDGRDDVIVTSQDSPVWQALTVSNDATLDDGFERRAKMSVIPIPGFSPPAHWIGPGSIYSEQGHPDNLLAGRSTALDVNGDGLPDFVQKSAGSWNSQELVAFVRTGPRVPLLTRLTNGLGAKTEIDYGQLTAAEIPDPDEPLAAYFPSDSTQIDAGNPRSCGIESGLSCRQPRHAVVTRVRTFPGSNSSEAHEYQHSYAGARTGLYGRGWLGFARHFVYQPTLEQTLSYEYDNVTRDEASGLFPYANHLVLLTQEAPLQRGDLTVQRVSTLTKTPALFRSPTSDRVIFVYDQIVETRVNERFDESGDLLSASKDVIEVDEFGNVTRDELTWGAGLAESEVITTHYKHENNGPFLEAWLINLPTSRTRSSHVPNALQADYTREVIADYYDTGLPKSFTVEPSLPDYKVEKSFIRDAFGALESVTTVGGGETRTASVLQLDERMVFPQLISDAEGYQTRFKVSGRLGTATGATSLGQDGSGVQLTRNNITDGFGRRRVVVEEDGRISNTSYTFGSDGSTGMVITSEAAGFPTVTMETDRNGRSILQKHQVLGGANLVSATSYDARGRTSKASRPALEGVLADPFDQAVLFDYDNLGRTIATVSADGNERHYCFAARVTCMEDEVHRITCADHDARGRVTFAADPVQGDPWDCDEVASDFKNTPSNERQGLKYSYGPFGFQERVTRGSTILTDARQDQLGRVHSRTDLGLAQKTFTYTAFGKLKTEVTAQDSVTWQYDALDRVRYRIDSLGQSEWVWRGDMPERIDFTQTSGDNATIRTASYDDVGRMNSVTRTIGGEDFVLSVTERDDFGHATIVSYPAAGAVPFKIENIYDPDSGILSEVRSVPNSATDETISFWKLTDINDFGQIETEVFGDGAATTERRYFDLGGQPWSITTTANGNQVEDLTYTYWEDGNIATRTDGRNGKTESFTYDQFARLDSVTEDGEEVKNYDYNDFGSLKNNGHDWSYEYLGTQPQAVNTIKLGASESVFTYSDDGYLTHRTSGPLPELNIEYSSFGKPTREWASVEADAATISYDADQQKVARVTPQQTTLYFDDFYYRVATTTSSTELVHHYVVTNGARAVAEVRRVDEVDTMEVRFLHDDRLGSVVAMTDLLGSGQTREYDHFGDSSGSDFSNIGYTGHHDEGIAGLIDMKGRTYDPTVGQFLQPDPLVTAPYTVQGFNRYSYVNNNPLRFTDPSGFQMCDELSASCHSFVPSPGPGPQSEPIPDPNTGPSMSMMSTPPPGGGMFSSIESGSDPGASGRAFSTESSAASGGQSIAPNMASVMPPHLQWNGQPLRYFMGIGNHKEIAAFYVEANPGSRVVTNTVPLSFIVEALGGDVSLLPGGALMPDIVNLTTRAIYEIKPFWMISQGAQDLENYVQAAAAANIVLTPGGPGPGTSGMLIYPSGYAIEFGWVAPGLIGYQRTMAPPIWEYVPVPRQNPSPVKWQRVKIDSTSVAAAGGTVLIGGIAWYYWAALPVLAFP